MINKVAVVSKMMSLCGGVFFSASALHRLYPSMSYEITSLYMWMVAVGIAAVAGAIRIKKETKLLWGLWSAGWGLIMALYSSYHGVLLFFVKIGPLVGYCLWVIYRLEKATREVEQQTENQEINSPDGKRYGQLFAISFFITVPTFVILMLCFSIFFEAIPKDQRGEALFWQIKMVIIGCVFQLVFIIYSYLFKKVHDFMIWVSVLVCMALGVIPGIAGFGWLYAIIGGLLWGVTAFYGGKMEQERWKAKKNLKI